ncbi:MAG: lysoplasmalogenase [Leptospiraceae bacterium]|nr:lysoplasmalogenase [Leptospiraceae bacterium]MCK6382154.1 lysoplasmalogenase [Leptospiraceae bacterium]NUM42999.1 lysoplasmalogenase [Leptospiraceae bacterium]
MLNNFILLGILHLVVSFYFPESQIGSLATKGLPILLLILYLSKKIGIHSHLKKFIFFGLFFSLIGDYLLIFPEYFVFGLGSFLFGHIFYIIGFSKGASVSVIKSIPIFLVGGGLFYIMYPGLGAMKIPVLFYIITISTMVWRAFSRSNVNRNSYLAGVFGACIFFISDSLIGIDKFYSHIFSTSVQKFLVMTTYYIGQFLIYKAAEKE